MAQRVLVDGIGYELRPTSEEELVVGLQEIDARTRAEGNPRVAQVYANPDDEDPPHLAIGLGADESLLVYTPGGLDGEGAYSKGPHVGDDGEVWFAYGDSDSEYQRWMLISRTEAINAVREFYRTGARPTSVAWESV